MYLDVYDGMCKRGKLENSEPEVYGTTLPLIMYPNQFDGELFEVMSFIIRMQQGDLPYDDQGISNHFLRDVVLPMAYAHACYKNKDIEEAIDQVNTVMADDWKRAGKEWLERRHVR